MVRATSKRSNTRARRMGVYTEQAYNDDRVIYRKYVKKTGDIVAKREKIDREMEHTRVLISRLDEHINTIKVDIKHGWGLASDSPVAAKALLNELLEKRDALSYKYAQLSSEYIALREVWEKSYKKENKYGIDSVLKRGRAYDKIPPSRRPRSKY